MSFLYRVDHMSSDAFAFVVAFGLLGLALIDRFVLRRWR